MREEYRGKGACTACIDMGKMKLAILAYMTSLLSSPLYIRIEPLMNETRCNTCSIMVFVITLMIIPPWFSLPRRAMFQADFISLENNQRLKKHMCMCARVGVCVPCLQL